MYGHYDQDTDYRRSLCKRHASEWRIIKSQHRRGPPWPLGKDGQEQTWLNERRSFSRYPTRPTSLRASSIFGIVIKDFVDAPRLCTFLKMHQGCENLSMVPREAIILFHYALVGISMPVYECRRWNHNAHSNFENVHFLAIPYQWFYQFFFNSKNKNWRFMSFSKIFLNTYTIKKFISIT